MADINDKVVTDSVLKKAITEVLQVVAENTFNFVEYESDEVNALFDGTPEQISYYESIINDSLNSENRLWSSKKIADEVAKAIMDSNAYADGLITNISSIELKYVTSLPATGNANTIYILKSTTSDPDTLNLYNDGAWIKIGDFNINLDSYATTDYVNTKLADKANSSEVLAVDKMQTTTGSETNDTVYSSKLTKDELDGKVDKTSILTANYTSATDDQVYSAKAMNIELDKKANMDKVGDNIIVTPHTQIGGVYTVKGSELNRLEIDVAKSGYTCIGLLSLQDNHGSYTQFKAWFVENNKVVIYVLAGDTFSDYIILASLLYKKN